MLNEIDFKATPKIIIMRLLFLLLISGITACFAATFFGNNDTSYITERYESPEDVRESRAYETTLWSLKKHISEISEINAIYWILNEDDEKIRNPKYPYSATLYLKVVYTDNYRQEKTKYLRTHTFTERDGKHIFGPNYIYYEIDENLYCKQKRRYLAELDKEKSLLLKERMYDKISSSIIFNDSKNMFQ